MSSPVIPASYDSRPDTWEHIHTVQGFLKQITDSLSQRARAHDQSKLRAPEVEVATLRHADGDLGRSIEQNAERFGYGEEFERLLRNTASDLGWL